MSMASGLTIGSAATHFGRDLGADGDDERLRGMVN